MKEVDKKLYWSPHKVRKVRKLQQAEIISFSLELYPNFTWMLEREKYMGMHKHKVKFKGRVIGKFPGLLNITPP